MEHCQVIANILLSTGCGYSLWFKILMKCYLVSAICQLGSSVSSDIRVCQYTPRVCSLVGREAPTNSVTLCGHVSLNSTHPISSHKLVAGELLNLEIVRIAPDWLSIRVRWLLTNAVTIRSTVLCSTSTDDTGGLLDRCTESKVVIYTRLGLVCRRGDPLTFSLAQHGLLNLRHHRTSTCRCAHSLAEGLLQTLVCFACFPCISHQEMSVQNLQQYV